MGFRVQGSGFGVQGLGFRVQGSGFRVQGAGFRVQGAGFRVQGSGFRVQGSGFRVDRRNHVRCVGLMRTMFIRPPPLDTFTTRPPFRSRGTNASQQLTAPAEQNV